VSPSGDVGVGLAKHESVTAFSEETVEDVGGDAPRAEVGGGRIGDPPDAVTPLPVGREDRLAGSGMGLEVIKKLFSGHQPPEHRGDGRMLPDVSGVPGVPGMIVRRSSHGGEI
jgi:hypothetical protein